MECLHHYHEFDSWYKRVERKHMEKVALFVIPFAGGSSTSYQGLKEQEYFELIILDLPGKGRNKSTKGLDDIQAMAIECTGYIKEFLKNNPERKYSIWGHSMGSYIAYEIIKVLLNEAIRMPEQLILSGSVAPERMDCNELREVMKNREAFTQYIIEFGLVKETVARSRFFQKMYLPSIENDYNTLIRYSTEKKKITGIRPLILNGKEDIFQKEDIEAWSEYFEDVPVFRWFSGKHFFFYEECDAVFETINKCREEK